MFEEISAIRVDWLAPLDGEPSQFVCSLSGFSSGLRLIIFRFPIGDYRYCFLVAKLLQLLSTDWVATGKRFYFMGEFEAFPIVK